MLDREALDDLAERASLEPWWPEGADEVADLAERPLQQSHGLADALRSGRVVGESPLQHLQLRQCREDVLHRPVVHVQDDALQLALTGREKPSGSGPSLGIPQLRHARPEGRARVIRSAAKASTAPIASAIATRTPPSSVVARRPSATPAPATAPPV